VSAYRDDIEALRARVVQLEEALAEAHRRLEAVAVLEAEKARLREDNERLRAELALLKPEPPVPDVATPSLVLEVTDPDGSERTVRFDQDVIKIGRAPSCHLVLADERVSRMHAVIEVGEDRTEIIDLGSEAGTEVNGERITQARLELSDVIRMGDTTLVVWLRA
jgi:hypothetical protein